MRREQATATATKTQQETEERLRRERERVAAEERLRRERETKERVAAEERLRLERETKERIAAEERLRRERETLLPIQEASAQALPETPKRVPATPDVRPQAHTGQTATQLFARTPAARPAPEEPETVFFNDEDLMLMDSLSRIELINI